MNLNHSTSRIQRSRIQWPFYTVAAALAATLLSGCVNPQIGGVDRYVATTATTFSEARVLFVDNIVKGTDGYEPGLRQLKFASEINDEGLNQAFSKDGTNRAKAQAAFVLHGQPLSILINKVTTPSFLGTRDIAVVLDILTQSTEKVQPLVVWYQRDVPGGRELAFENLLVHFTPTWDSKTPAHFRIRLIDVETEDNAATVSVLEKVEKLAAMFSGTIPHPIMPGVEIGLQAAKLILGNKSNTLLMDYTVEFYAAADAKSFGGADIGYLRTGQWIAVGLNRKIDAETWRTPKYFDRRTLRVYDAESLTQLKEGEKATEIVAPPSGPVNTHLKSRGSRRPRVDSPVVLMTVGTAEAVVPTIVQDRSEALVQLLASPPEKLNLDSLQNAVSSLNSSVKVFAIKRRVEKEQTTESMASLFDLLAKHNAAIDPTANDDAKLHKLSDSDLHLLLLTLERNTTLSSPPTSAKLWHDWWVTGVASGPAGKTGSFQYDESLKRKMWKN